MWHLSSPAAAQLQADSFPSPPSTLFLVAMLIFLL